MLFKCFCFKVEHVYETLNVLVEVRLHEPLWKVQFSPEDVALELLTLCSQLEVLCKKEYTVNYVVFFTSACEIYQ